jgi:hypothetical protein
MYNYGDFKKRRCITIDPFALVDIAKCILIKTCIARALLLVLGRRGGNPSYGDDFW